MINQLFLKSRLHYDPSTGFFTWISGHRSGSRAGYLDARGYRRIHLLWRRSFSEHRLAWLYSYGSWPHPQIDHINRIKSDNRLSNLRLASTSQNGQNIVRSPSVGTRFLKKANLWHAHIQTSINGVSVRYSLGCFPTRIQAVAARLKAARLLHRSFSPD